jgi:gamma-glutamyltranspeptidase/glutathione hydrolase
MNGVIAAGHPQTAQAGAEILAQGGNAVDAAVAATFASFVAESALVNIGGGGIAHIYNPTTGRATVYDFFSTMPGLSLNGHHPLPPLDKMDFRQVLIDFGATVQPFYIGRASVAVPGIVAGLAQLLAEAGTLPLAKVLEPAIRLAREGVVVTSAQEYVIHLLTPILTDTPAIAATYAPGGKLVTLGDTLIFPKFAATLTQLGQEGATLFYTGAIGRQILADQQAHGGLLTETDLARYQVYETNSIAVPYRGYTIELPGPSSAGGPLIAFSLKLLAELDLPGMAHNGPAHLRALTEVMRLTNLARARWEQQLDDSGPTKNGRAEALLSPENVADYRRQLAAALASNSLQPDTVSRQGPSNTTHISVADANGMLAAITTSAGECAGFMVGQTGLKLNNMLGEIDLHRNGFHQLPPGRRLMTMMSPVLVLKNGRPVLAIGSGGSNRLRTAILQVISNVIDFRLHLEEAVDAPRLHFEDGVAQLEGGIPPASAAAMEAAGYQINRWPARNMFFGGAHVVAREAGRWTAAGDRRRGGSTVVNNQ